MPEDYWDKGRGEWRKSEPIPYLGKDYSETDIFDGIEPAREE